MTDTTRFKKPKFANVFSTPTGGHYVRARVTDPTTDKLVQIKKTLSTPDALEAFQWLQGEIDRIRSGVALPQPAKLRFSEFAAQLLEDKLKTGEIKSAAGHTRWVCTLQHLIAGTTGDKSEKFVSAFGDTYIDMLHVSHVEQWKLGVAGLIKAGDYAPATANGWLSILRVICKAAKRKFGLAHLATEDVPDFDTSDWVTYSEEEPNSLLPEQCLCSWSVFAKSTRSTTRWRSWASPLGFDPPAFGRFGAAGQRPTFSGLATAFWSVGHKPSART
jgi:hypothetical protein